MQYLPCLLGNSANSCGELPALGIQKYKVWDASDPVLGHFVSPFGVINI